MRRTGARGPRLHSGWRRGAAMLLAAALAGPWAGPMAAHDTLRVLAWPGYADPDVVAAFEKRHDVSVEVNFVESDDQLYERLSANGGGDYDVFAANTAELQRYIDAGLSVPIHLASISNHARQLPRFQNLAQIPGLVHAGEVYAIPFTFSAMGLIYNPAIVHPPPRSMKAMWDPRYRRKVLAYDTSNHNFSVAALAFGIGRPFALDEAGFAAAVDRLIQLRRNVLTFYSTPEEVVDLWGRHQVALVFGNYGSQQVKLLEAAGHEVGYVIPDEGALAWLDCWAITAGVRNRTLAQTWIDYTLEPAVSGALTRRHGLANTIERTSGTTQAEDRIIWLEPLEDYPRRQNLWQRIRSGDPAEAFR